MGDLKKLSPHIGFFKCTDEQMAVVCVLGFTVTYINGPNPYYQALCIPLPTASGSSHVYTQHYVMMKNFDVNQMLTSSFVIPISLNRLVLGRATVLKFDQNETRYCVGFRKLCIRQGECIDSSDLLEDVNKTRGSATEGYTVCW